MGKGSYVTPVPLIAPSTIAWFNPRTTALGAAATWANSARKNNATQGTGANQSINTANIFRNTPGMLFNGTSTRMDFATAITLAGEFTIFWVAQVTSLVAGGNIIGDGTSTSKISTSNSSLGNFGIVVVNGGSSDATIAHPAINTPYIGMLTRDGSNKVDLAINNGSLNRLYADAAQSGNAVFGRIGRDNVPRSWDGYMGDIIICSQNLTAAQKTSFWRYLSNITGIAIS